MPHIERAKRVSFRIRQIIHNSCVRITESKRRVFYGPDEVAEAVVALVWKKAPSEFEVFARAHRQSSSGLDVAAEWCRRHSLGSATLQLAASDLATKCWSGDTPTRVLTHVWNPDPSGSEYLRLDEDGQIVHLVWRSGESERAFVQRCRQEYRKMRAAEAWKRVKRSDLRAFSRRQVEWFVQYQVDCVPPTKIGPSEDQSKQVRHAVKSVAAILGVSLRTSPRGRPRART